MEELKTNSGQNLGIAALITGIITFIFAVIPCVGVVAIIPGIIAIVLASVGLSQATRNNSPKGVLLAGLIVGIIALMISFAQIFVIGKIAKHKDKWPSDIQSVINDVKNDVMKDLEDANISIKIESFKRQNTRPPIPGHKFGQFAVFCAHRHTSGRYHFDP